jgi:hypothetical protein
MQNIYIYICIYIYWGVGLITTINRSKDFKSRLRGWRSKRLLWAGISTMIKLVAQALPTYTFSTFNVPNTVCDKLDVVTRRFLWNPKKESGKFITWKAWDQLCQPKQLGGLKFKKAKRFNEALLAKLSWMVISKRVSICMQALRSKHKVRHDWLRREPIKNASKTWQAIEKMKKLLLKGVCYLVGNGTSIDVWKDSWVLCLEGYKPVKRDENVVINPLSVASLIN